MRTIDLNCDMGEGFGPYTIGDDAGLMPLVTTANIACGFHGGDPSVMRDTLSLAKTHGVAVGAHPSFMDLYGFGRRRIAGERPEDVEAQLVYQIAAIAGMADALAWPITHVKTHGALNNMAAEDRALAETCVRAVKAVDASLVLVAMPYSETMKAAERAGLGTASEVFADRAYTAAGMLAPRGREGAVIHDPQRSLDQVLSMVLHGHIPTLDGGRLPVEPATLCIHGDTRGAAGIARTLRTALEREGVAIAPFAAPGRAGR